MRALVGLLVLLGGCVYRVDPPFDGGNDAPVLCDFAGDAPGGFDGGGLYNCCNLGEEGHPLWRWVSADTVTCGGCRNCGGGEVCSADGMCVLE